MTNDPNKAVPPRRIRGLSNYSASERSRIRLALLSYADRNGLSAEKILNGIRAKCPDRLNSAIKDRVQVWEFLKGAEQKDDKIEAYLSFLQIVDPISVKYFGDDELLDGMALNFHAFHTGNNTHSSYERALDNESISQLHGMFSGIQYTGNKSSDYIVILNFRGGESINYKRCDVFEIGINSLISLYNAYSKEYGLSEEFGDQKILELESLIYDYEAQSLSRVVTENISHLVSLFLEIIFKNIPNDIIESHRLLRASYAGVLIASNKQKHLYLRSVLRRSAIKSIIRQTSPSKYMTVIMGQDETIRSVDRLIHSAITLQSDIEFGPKVLNKLIIDSGLFSLSFSKQGGPLLQNIVNRISWSLP